MEQGPPRVRSRYGFYAIGTRGLLLKEDPGAFTRNLGDSISQADDWKCRGVAISVGGPWLTLKLTPTEEELRSRYNPDLLKKSIEGREEREQEFDEFVTRLKAYSKSDKPSAYCPQQLS